MTYSLEPTECELCFPGSSTSAQGSPTCPLCEPGSYQDEYGQTSCKSCPEGSYCEGDGTQTPTLCDPGSFSEGQVGSCPLCEPGSYQDVSGQSSCKECPAGSICTSSGVVEPETCAAGTVSEAGSQVCSPCVTGSYVDVVGGTSCTQCPTGRTTQGTGTATADGCINVLPNIVFGVVVAIIAFFASVYYVGYDHMYRFAQSMTSKGVNVVLGYAGKALCDSALILSSAKSRKLHKKLLERSKQNLHSLYRKLCSLLKFLFVGIVCLAIIAAIVFFSMILRLLKLLFMAVIMIRGGLGVGYIVDQIGEVINYFRFEVPIPFFAEFLEPFASVMVFLATFKIDLKALEVTCKGKDWKFDNIISMRIYIYMYI